MSNSPSLLTENLKRLKTVYGVSTSTIAEMLNVSVEAASDIEAGARDLSVKEVFLLAEKLGASVSDLLTESPEKTTERFNRYCDIIHTILRTHTQISPPIYPDRRRLAHLTYLIDLNYHRLYQKTLTGQTYRKSEGMYLAAPDEFSRAIDTLYYQGRIQISPHQQVYCLGLSTSNKKLDTDTMGHVSACISHSRVRWMHLPDQELAELVAESRPYRDSVVGGYIAF